jgi:hypothetical protein
MLIPCTILLIVATLQFRAAYVGTLTPWKGGGFGMFATVDSLRNRFLAITATDLAGRQYHVVRPFGPDLGAFDALWFDDTLSRPTQRRLDDLAQAVLNTPLLASAATPTRLPGHIAHSTLGRHIVDQLPPHPILEINASARASTLNIVEVRVRARRLRFDARSMRVTVAEFGPIGIARVVR